jgi:hypothetical protein
MRWAASWRKKQKLITLVGWSQGVQIRRFTTFHAATVLIALGGARRIVRCEFRLVELNSLGNLAQVRKAVWQFVYFDTAWFAVHKTIAPFS